MSKTDKIPSHVAIIMDGNAAGLGPADSNATKAIGQV